MTRFRASRRSPSPRGAAGGPALAPTSFVVPAAIWNHREPRTNHVEVWLPSGGLSDAACKARLGILNAAVANWRLAGAPVHAQRHPFKFKVGDQQGRFGRRLVLTPAQLQELWTVVDPDAGTLQLPGPEGQALGPVRLCVWGRSIVQLHTQGWPTGFTASMAQATLEDSNLPLKVFSISPVVEDGVLLCGEFHVTVLLPSTVSTHLWVIETPVGRYRVSLHSRFYRPRGPCPWSQEQQQRGRQQQGQQEQGQQQQGQQQQGQQQQGQAASERAAPSGRGSGGIPGATPPPPQQGLQQQRREQQEPGPTTPHQQQPRGQQKQQQQEAAQAAQQQGPAGPQGREGQQAGGSGGQQLRARQGPRPSSPLPPGGAAVAMGGSGHRGPVSSTGYRPREEGSGQGGQQQQQRGASLGPQQGGPGGPPTASGPAACPRPPPPVRVQEGDGAGAGAGGSGFSRGGGFEQQGGASEVGSVPAKRPPGSPTNIADRKRAKKERKRQERERQEAEQQRQQQQGAQQQREVQQLGARADAPGASPACGSAAAPAPAPHPSWRGALRQYLEDQAPDLEPEQLQQVAGAFFSRYAAEVAAIPTTDRASGLPLPMITWLQAQLRELGVVLTYPDSDSDGGSVAGMDPGDTAPPLGA